MYKYRQNGALFLLSRHLLLLVLLLAGYSLAGHSADYWQSPVNAAVFTNSDCGKVVAVAGQTLIRRSFQDNGAAGDSVRVADKVNSGDVVIVPLGARMEVASGANTLVVIGSGSEVVFSGLRKFADRQGKTVSRLDIRLVAGEIRVQVRLHHNSPEAALVTMTGGEMLLQRGDAVLLSSQRWHASVIAGDIQVRNRHGDMAGAVFSLLAGSAAGGAKPERISEQDMLALKARLPFSFELHRAALPPAPVLEAEAEAP